MIKRHTRQGFLRLCEESRRRLLLGSLPAGVRAQVAEAAGDGRLVTPVRHGIRPGVPGPAWEGKQ